MNARARSKRPKAERPIRWSAQTFIVTGFVREPRVLGVIVDPSSCAVLAFEGPMPTHGASEATTLAAFFGDHAHQCIHPGDGLTFAEAVRLAEEFGKKWKAGELEPAAACDCGEIGKAAHA